MKTIAVLIEDTYQILEVWYPYLRLKEAGFTPSFVGTGRKKEYFSKEGYPVTEEISVTRCKKRDFDAVVIPGGYAPDILRRYAPINSLVKRHYQNGRIIASICHGGWVLCSAGILPGKKVTGFFAIQDDLTNAGAHYVDKPVVVDGTLITSRKPADLPAFCNALILMLDQSRRK